MTEAQKEVVATPSRASAVASPVEAADGGADLFDDFFVACALQDRFEVNSAAVGH